MNLFHLIQSDIDVDSLVPITDIGEYVDNPESIVDFAVLDNFIENLKDKDITEDNFYYVPNSLFNHVVFINNYFQYGLPIMQEEQGEFGILKHSAYSIDKAYDLQLAGDYAGLIWLLDKPQRIKYLSKFKNYIKKEDMLDLALEVYYTSEYGFNAFDKDILNDIIFKEKLSDEDIKSITEKYDVKDGYVSVYRGEQNLSTPNEQAYSWTLDKETAIYFANRFKESTSSVIYEAKVKLDDVHAYITGRSEEEVIVQHRNLKDVQKLK